MLFAGPLCEAAKLSHFRMWTNIRKPRTQSSRSCRRVHRLTRRRGGEVKVFEINTRHLETEWCYRVVHSRLVLLQRFGSIILINKTEPSKFWILRSCGFPLPPQRDLTGDLLTGGLPTGGLPTFGLLSSSIIICGLINGNLLTGDLPADLLRFCSVS